MSNMLRNRLLALGLFILSVIGISLTGGAVSYGFFFFMLLVPLVSLIYSFIVFFRFKIYQRLESRTVVADSPAVFYFTLQNEDFFAHSGIRTEFFTDFSSISGLDSDTEYELLPHTGITKETVMVCKYRGEYEVGIANVIVTDYLRLFSVRFKNRETLKVTVLPRLVTLEAVGILDELSLSNRENSANLNEPDVLTREYVPGDDVKNIHWKASARSRKLMVRKRTGESTRGMSIIMDSHRYSNDISEYIPLENKILETVLALTYYNLSKGIAVNIYAYEQKGTLYSLDGMGPFNDFYQSMSHFYFMEDATSDRLFALPGSDHSVYESNAVILILHEWSEAADLFVKGVDRYSIPVFIFLINDVPGNGGPRGLSERIKCLTIGYEDRLQEVLA